MRETKKHSNYENVKVGDVTEIVETTYTPIRPLTMLRKDINGTQTMDTKVTIHHLTRVDEIDGLGLNCHCEIRVTLESEAFPCKECAIWFEDEEGFVYLPNVKKINDSVGNCCFAEIQGETEQIESSMVIINKETVFRKAVDDFLSKNELK